MAFVVIPSCCSAFLISDVNNDSDSGSLGSPYKMAGKKKGEISNPIRPSPDNMRTIFREKKSSENSILNALAIPNICEKTNSNRKPSKRVIHFVIKYCPENTPDFSFRIEYRTNKP